MSAPESKLFVVATPIGHKDDLTLRARTIFEQSNIFFAEDSRETKKLFGLHGLSMSEKRFHSYAKHNLKDATEKALSYLKENQNVVLVCDRGTPAISDPGAQLVLLARQLGVAVIPIPGASAVTTLLSVSGHGSDFWFVGFLPVADKNRKELWDKVERNQIPLCFFESPQRIQKTAEELKARFKGSQLCWGRELTKQFESVLRCDLDALDPKALIEKGEYTVLLLPAKRMVDDDTNLALLDQAIFLRTCPEKQWAKHYAAELGVTSKDIYNKLQKSKT